MSERELPAWKTAAWRDRLLAWVLGLLAFETLTGLYLWLSPFSVSSQYALLLHTAAGLVFLVPCGWFQAKHWWYNREAPPDHVTLTGYFSLAATLVAVVSGLVLTGQGLFGREIGAWWDFVHIVSTLAVVGSVGAHLVIDVRRFAGAAPMEEGPGGSGRPFRAAVGAASRSAGAIVVVLVAGVALLATLYGSDAGATPGAATRAYGGGGPGGPAAASPTAADHDGEEAHGPYAGSGASGSATSPFGPSLARTRFGETVDPALLGGSASCGSAGCHEQIWREWRSGAHRYAAMDTSFRTVQRLFAEERGRRATRYCAGCHDPISLLAGTRVSDGGPLTHEIGRDEGVSCLACHAMTRVDVRGNADFVLEVPERYLFWEDEGGVRQRLHHFLLRTYPDRHRESLQPTLLKTPEFCGTCHKQFVEPEVNGVGWVGLQNQYDDWRKSRWNHPGEPGATVQCRECHMPLVASNDPAAGDALDYNRTADDGMHRSHRLLGANQAVPLIHDLPGAEEHVELTEEWLRGELDVPEIAEKWRSGAAVPVTLEVPERVDPGDTVGVRVRVTNQKPGHRFPTGPLDLIEAWVHVRVTAASGRVVFESGATDSTGAVGEDAFVFRSESVDPRGRTIHRHELWDLVGVRWTRSVFPGFSDQETFRFPAPERAGGSSLRVEAELLYRKFNPTFRAFLEEDGPEMNVPVTVISRAERSLRVGSTEHRAGPTTGGRGAPGGSFRKDAAPDPAAGSPGDPEARGGGEEGGRR